MGYKPDGNPATASIIVVGEAPAKQEMIYGRPLVGPSGQLFEDCITEAKLNRYEMFLTNVFEFMVKKNDKDGTVWEETPTGDLLLWSPKSGFTDHGMDRASHLRDELVHCTRANVIITLGNIASQFFTGKAGITNIRGSVLQNIRMQEAPEKVIPTIHPAAVLRGQSIWRWLIVADLRRVKKEMTFPEIIRPEYNFDLFPTHAKCVAWLRMILDTMKGKYVGWDIEIENRHISRIAFSIDGLNSMSIPFTAGWSEEEELVLWDLVAEVIGHPEIGNIGQNIMFDISMMWSQMRIETRGDIRDTYCAHHIMYQEFPRSLAFFMSLYTDQPYHKDMVKHHGGIEKADG